MDRRRLLQYVVGAGLAGRAAASRAQPAGRPLRRIGHLSFGTAPSGSQPDPDVGFRDNLRALGYVDGRDLVVESRYANGQPERLAALAAELVQMKVDLIFVGGPAPTLAARKATSTIPIVTASGGDPVAEGWAKSLARPGGNVTGLTVTFPELGSKRLELLKQAVPGLTRVAMLWTPVDLRPTYMEGSRAGALALGLETQSFEVGGPGDFEPAFEAMQRARVQGLYAISTNLIVSYRARLAALAIRHKLPAVADFSLLADAGFLMSYGADLDVLGRRAAVYVDKIVKGAQPGDLPIERPTAFELIANQKSAKAMGLALPQALLLRADRVIE